MKPLAVSLVAVLGAACIGAQPPPGTISHPRQPTSSAAGSTNQTPSGTLTFTNRAGETYSVAQLAEQLRQLRGNVEQTLPLLTAFNETLSASSPGSGTNATGSVAGVIAGILGALNRNTNQAAGGPQTSPGTSNLMGVLQGVLGTNAAGAAPLDAEAVQGLLTLQHELQPVQSTLEKLNIAGASTNQLTPPSLTPTGR